jgi:hypothetical protein
MNYLLPMLLVALSLGGLALVYWALRGQRVDLYAPTDMERYAAPVDLAAFQALLDEQNDGFLRDRLPPAELRAFQRERCRIAAGYVVLVARNAAVLTRLGELARGSVDPQTARAGAELANAAIRVRLLALMAYARLRLEMLHPAAPQYAGDVVGLYQSLADRATNVAGLLEPASGMRCARTLYSY